MYYNLNTMYGMKILTRTFSKTQFTMTLLACPIYVIQSKFALFSTLNRYIRREYEVLHKLCMVIKQAFIHLEIYLPRKTSG